MKLSLLRLTSEQNSVAKGYQTQSSCETRWKQYLGKKPKLSEKILSACLQEHSGEGSPGHAAPHSIA